MASMQTCPEELVRIFVEYVHDTSPGTMSSLALVNKAFHQHVVDCRFRRWKFRNDDVVQDIRYIADNEGTKKVRRVNIMDYMAVRLRVCKLLPSLTALQDIELTCGVIPKGTRRFLNHLESRPDIRLHLTISPGIWHLTDPQTLAYIQDFEKCKNLYSLSVNHQYDDRESCLKMTTRLKGVLLTCNNLRHVRIDIERFRYYDTGPSSYCGFGFVGDERIPAALETLEVIAYPFGKKDIHRDRNRPNTEGYPLVGYEQLYWTQKFDWSNLTRLSVRDAWAWIPCLDELAFLKEVDFTRDPDDEFTQKFLLGVPNKLESIKMYGMADNAEECIVKHGIALRELHIIRDSWGREGMLVDAKILQKIRVECPNIERLGIGFRRNEEFPEDIMREIVQFPKVRELTLYFDLDRPGFGSKLQPAATYEGTSDMMNYLLRPKGRYRFPIRELHLVTGNFYPRPVVSTASWHPRDEWMKNNSVTITSKLSERDDEAKMLVSYITCPGLADDELEILKKAKIQNCAPMELVDRSPSFPRLKMVSPKFWLISTGPLDWSRWFRYDRWIHKPGEKGIFKGTGKDYVVETEDDWKNLQGREEDSP